MKEPLNYNDEAFHAKCPHCGGHVKVQMGLRIAAITVDTTRQESPPAEKETPPPPPPRFTKAQHAFIEQAQRNGMLEAFRTAVENGPMAGQMPKDIEGFFLLALRTARPCLVPKRVLDMLVDSFGGQGFVEVFSSQGVAIVTVDKYLRAFVPVQLAKGDSVNRNGSLVFRQDVDDNELRNWIKTRRGYVPVGSAVFLESLRKVSIGEFANPVL